MYWVETTYNKHGKFHNLKIELIKQINGFKPLYWIYKSVYKNHD
jgi:hypothetical protein